MRVRMRWTFVITIGLVVACSTGPTSNVQGAGTLIAPPDATVAESSSSVPPGWIEYSDPSGVQLAHPPDWTVEPGVAGPVIVYIDPASSGTFRRNINGTLQAAHGLTLEQFVDLSQKQFDQANAEVVSEGETTFAGSPAYEWRYRLRMGSQDLAFWGVATMRGDRPWLFTYTADPSRFDEGLEDVAALYGSVLLPT